MHNFKLFLLIMLFILLIINELMFIIKYRFIFLLHSFLYVILYFLIEFLRLFYLNHPLILILILIHIPILTIINNFIIHVLKFQHFIHCSDKYYYQQILFYLNLSNLNIYYIK